MRNPFKKVYCEDCEHCILANYPNKSEQMEFAKCKADPKKRYNIFRRESENYFYCSSTRFWKFSFCFKFKAKT